MNSQLAEAVCQKPKKFWHSDAMISNTVDNYNTVREHTENVVT